MNKRHKSCAQTLSRPRHGVTWPFRPCVASHYHQTAEAKRLLSKAIRTLRGTFESLQRDAFRIAITDDRDSHGMYFLAATTALRDKRHASPGSLAIVSAPSRSAMSLSIGRQFSKRRRAPKRTILEWERASSNWTGTVDRSRRSQQTYRAKPSVTKAEHVGESASRAGTVRSSTWFAGPRIPDAVPPYRASGTNYAGLYSPVHPKQFLS